MEPTEHDSDYDVVDKLNEAISPFDRVFELWQTENYLQKQMKEHVKNFVSSACDDSEILHLNVPRRSGATTFVCHTAAAFLVTFHYAAVKIVASRDQHRLIANEICTLVYEKYRKGFTRVTDVERMQPHDFPLYVFDDAKFSQKMVPGSICNVTPDVTQYFFHFFEDDDISLERQEVRHITMCTEPLQETETHDLTIIDGNVLRFADDAKLLSAEATLNCAKILVVGNCNGRERAKLPVRLNKWRIDVVLPGGDALPPVQKAEDVPVAVVVEEEVQVAVDAEDADYVKE